MCSVKRKVLMILIIFKILKIHYKHLAGVFNKYTLVYSEKRFSKILYQTETIFAKQINWQLTGFHMIPDRYIIDVYMFFLKGTFKQILVLSKILQNLLWYLPNVFSPFKLVFTCSKSAKETLEHCVKYVQSYQ